MKGEKAGLLSRPVLDDGRFVLLAVAGHQARGSGEEGAAGAGLPGESGICLFMKGG